MTTSSKCTAPARVWFVAVAWARRHLPSANVIGPSAVRLFALTAALVGCSSTTNNTTVAPCGPGTSLVDGQCVVGDGGSAETTGGDANDRTGDTAVNDARGPDAVGVDTASDGGVLADSEGLTDTVDSAGADEPCPPKSINCSNTCGATDPVCDEFLCRDYTIDAYPRVVVDSGTPLPVNIRTPHISAAFPQCASEACTPPLAYALAFKVTTPPTIPLRVRVNAPWTVDFYSGDPHHPFCTGAGGQCMMLDRGALTYDLQVSAFDTAAPSRNIVIEAAPSGGCP